MLDYVMLKLGVDTETLQNPVAMTETLCNPAYSRSCALPWPPSELELPPMEVLTRKSIAVMTELLFESYSAPAVSYGVDSLLSLYANSPDPSTADALVISSSTASTHIIPVLGGRGILTSAKKCVALCSAAAHRSADLASAHLRLNWGGAQSAEYLLKLMQLKYPAFPGRLTSYQSSVRVPSTLLRRPPAR